MQKREKGSNMRERKSEDARRTEWTLKQRKDSEDCGVE